MMIYIYFFSYNYLLRKNLVLSMNNVCIFIKKHINSETLLLQKVVSMSCVCFTIKFSALVSGKMYRSTLFVLVCFWSYLNYELLNITIRKLFILSLLKNIYVIYLLFCQ